MNNDPRSHGLWEQSAPPAPTTSSLEDSIAVDVVVIGAGFTGLSAAVHLREMGVDVAVLEGEEIGFGGSGRNVGLVNAGLWMRPADVIAGLGRERGHALIEQLGKAPGWVFGLIERYGIQCEPVRNGTLHCAVGDSGYHEIAERARQWQALGAPVCLLDSAATERKVGSDAYRGSLLDRRAGTIQPLAYVRGLASAALRMGARIFTGTPVTSISDEQGSWRVNAREGSVRADWVIVATNAYSSILWTALREELVALPYFNVATRPLRPHEHAAILPERQGLWDTRKVLSSLRTDAAGRLIFGSVGALRGAGKGIHRNWSKRALARLFPKLKDVELVHEWYGQIGMTANAIPRFHELARNTVSISGYNGRGIAPGTSFGRDLARLAAGKIARTDIPLPVTTPQQVRLRAVREAFYEYGSEILHSFGARL